MSTPHPRIACCLVLAAAWLQAGCAPEPSPADAPDPELQRAAPALLPADESDAQPLPAVVEPAAIAETAAAATSTPDSSAAPPRDPGPVIASDGRTLILLGQAVSPGSFRRLSWSAGISFEGTATETPVLVAHGSRSGPMLCLTAAVHGDELNGIEIVRRILHDLDPGQLSGTVVGLPIVNLHGFRRGSRYLPDRRDLNRYFPGNASGSAASRIARSLFDNVIRHCDALVDIHTGSLNRTNLPQLRGDLRNPEVRAMAEGFGDMVVLHSAGPLGTLRRAATDAGIPAVTMEAGEPMRLDPAKVNDGVEGIFTLLDRLAMLPGDTRYHDQEPVYYSSSWIRADYGGILFSVARLGQQVEVGDVLGIVTDPISNEQNLIYSTVAGKVVGMALNQVVMPGFATFNIGVETGIPEAAGRIASAEAGEEAPWPEEAGRAEDFDSAGERE